MTYIALDIGNVLVDVNFDNLLNKLSSILNIPKDEATYFLNRCQKLHDLGMTTIDVELRDHLKIKSEVLIDELLACWNDCINPNEAIISIFEELQQNLGLKIALLSNIGLEHSAAMPKKLYGIYDNSLKYFSCDVGARKPSMIYYHVFLQLHPEWLGALYIDDMQENLDMAKNFGFKTYRFSLKDIKNDSVKKLKEVIFKECFTPSPLSNILNN